MYFTGVIFHLHAVVLRTRVLLPHRPAACEAWPVPTNFLLALEEGAGYEPVAGLKDCTNPANSLCLSDNFNFV